MEYFMKAMENGADRVLVAGCLEEDATLLTGISLRKNGSMPFEPYLKNAALKKSA
jgi:coenzyme F420-reducing hydrogenase delta subunit